MSAVQSNRADGAEVGLAVRTLEGKALGSGGPRGRVVLETMVDQWVGAAMRDLPGMGPVGPHHEQGEQERRVADRSELALERDPSAVRRPLGEAIRQARRLTGGIDEGPMRAVGMDLVQTGVVDVPVPGHLILDPTTVRRPVRL